MRKILFAIAMVLLVGAYTAADEGGFVDVFVGGGGDMSGPETSTDNAVPRYDGTDGGGLQNSGVTIDDSDNMDVPGAVTVGGTVTGGTSRVEVTSTGSLSDAQVRGTFVTNYGMSVATDTTLPAYSGSTMCTVLVEAGSQTWSFKPPSGEAFVLDGTPLNADYEIDIGDTVGDMLTLVRIRTGASSYQWYAWTASGTHTYD